MASKESSFRFWGNWLRAVEWMEDESEKGAFLLKIARFAINGEEPDLSTQERMAWELIKTALESECAARSNGAAGGRRRAAAKADGEPCVGARKTADASAKGPASGSGNGVEAFETEKEGVSQDPLQGWLKSEIGHFCESERPTFYECEREGEYKGELKKEKIKEKSGASPDEGGAPYPVACLAAFNRAMGSCYGQLPPTSARFLAMHAAEFGAKWPPEAVGRMVAFKRAEWEGDRRMKRNLTPNTLLGPDHFEQYMHQAKQAESDGKEAEDGGRFSAYRPKRA